MANLLSRMVNPSNMKICLHQLLTSGQPPRLSLVHGDTVRRVCQGWRASAMMSRAINHQPALSASSHLGSVKFLSTSNQQPSKQSEHKHKPPDTGESKPSESSQPVIDPILTKPDPELVRYVDDLINYVEKPQRRGITILKVLVTLMAGLYFGAFLAKLGANLLEEYEIFVRGDDDDD